MSLHLVKTRVFTIAYTSGTWMCLLSKGPKAFKDSLVSYAGGDLQGPRCACWELTFNQESSLLCECLQTKDDSECNPAIQFIKNPL